MARQELEMGWILASEGSVQGQMSTDLSIQTPNQIDNFADNLSCHMIAK